jgi:hypothetical protein
LPPDVFIVQPFPSCALATWGATNAPAKLTEAASAARAV